MAINHRKSEIKPEQYCDNGIGQTIKHCWIGWFYTMVTNTCTDLMEASQCMWFGSYNNQ